MSSEENNAGTEAPTTAPGTDDDEIVTWWGLVIEGYLATQDLVMSEISERFDLPPASFDILLRLVRSPDGRMTMSKLANEAALSSGGFTKVADRLVKAELIRREPCDTDRRITYAALTEHGHDTAEKAKHACADSLREHVIGPLGDTESANLARAMRTLRAANAET